MRVVSKLEDLISKTIFKRMISMNKIQIRSFLLALIFLCFKSILGIWLLLTIFLGDDHILVSIMIAVRNDFRHASEKSINAVFLITTILTIMNGSAVLLYFHPFKGSFSQKLSKMLLILMLMFESIQCLGIVVISSNILKYIFERNYFMVLLECINLLLIICLILIFKGFYFTISHAVKNILGRFPSTHNAMVEFLTMVLILILAFVGSKGLNLTQKIIFNVCFLILKTLTINYSLRKWHYTDSTIQCIYAFLQIMETVALIFNLILQITRQPLMGQNFYVCVFITASFCFFGWKNYFLHEQQVFYFYKAKDIKLITEAALYFKALYDLSGKGQKNNESSLVLSSIRKQHEIQCQNKLCYCQGIVEDEDFAKDYILQQLDDLRKQFKGQPKILIQELNFRFKMYNTYPDVLTRLQKIKNVSTLGIIENFSIDSLKMDLIEWMGDRNRTANTIDIETPLTLEQTTQQIQNIIQKDIDKKSSKWKYLSQGLCRTDQLEEDTNAQINFIKQINKIQHLWNKKMKRSTLFNFLLLFYYKKVSFLNVNVEAIYKNINETMKKVKEEELSSIKQFAKCLFHKRSCVIQSPINEENMGIVTRASKNVYDLFGYQQNKIIGINLNRLMPNFMAIQHDIILSQWVRNGTWRTVGKLKQIFCIHKDQYCFNALLYLKIIANEKGLFFMTVIFKKNQSDYLILNSKRQIQGIGRKFLQVIGSNCRRLPIEVLFDSFPEQQIPKNFQYKSFTRTFRSFRNNQQFVDEFFQNKSLLIQREHTLNDLIREYQQRLNLSLNLERWEVKFHAKLYKMRQVRYYVILLNHARLIRAEDKSSMSTIEHGKCDNILVGHGKMNEDQDSSFNNSKNSSESTAGENQTRFIDDKGSSVSSFAERENFTLTKLLNVFFGYLIRPQKISDKRINQLNISTLLQTVALTIIITICFFVYIGRMNDVEDYMRGNGDVNQNMQRVFLMYNRVISFQQYRNQKDTLAEILQGTMGDMNEYYSSISWQLGHINQIKSSYSKQKIYSYLDQPMDWHYRENKDSFALDSIEFFQFYYYFTGQVALDVYTDFEINLVTDRKYQIYAIKNNFPQLKNKTKQFNNRFIQLTQNSINHLSVFDSLISTFFAVISFLFFIFTCNYHRFRHSQKYQCLHIYKAIPPQLIITMKNYYHQLNSDFKHYYNKNTGMQVDFHTFTQHQLIFQQNTYSTNNSHIKFLGRKKFHGWIRPLFMFLMINVINFVISFQVVGFMSPLDKLMINVNNIMNSENQLFQSYLLLKGSYFLSQTPNITDSLINDVMQIVSRNQVPFNKMVTFTSQTLTDYDPNFLNDFRNILINNVCQEVKQHLNGQEFNYCMKLSQKSMISEGIITFMNHFQRKLRSAVIDLKQNWQLRFETQGQDYFKNRGFKDIDMVMTFNIKLFRKLTKRINEAYQKGVDYITIINYIIVGLLIMPQIIVLMLWFHLATRQKNKLSFLYGSLLTIPPQLIRQVKNLPRLAKKILQFSQT